MSKKKGRPKTGAGPDPTHGAYLAGLKGITSNLKDLDFIETDFRLYALAAEENGQITAYSVEQESATD